METIHQNVFNIYGTILQIAYIILPFILAKLHIILGKINLPKRRLEIYFLYYVVIAVGVQGLAASLFQLTNPEKISAYIGWQVSPFLREVAFANLAFGLLGIASIWIVGSWKLASGIGYSIFLFLAAIGHIINMVETKNYAPGNAGPTLFSDIAIPIIFAIILSLYWREHKKVGQ